MADQGLIVPDVHENIPLLEQILQRYLPTVQWVVCLGDYFDSFRRSDSSTLRTVHWLREALADPRITLLLGNHDLHYLWPHARWFRCSGFYPPTLELLQKELPLDTRWKLQDPRGRILVEKQGWLLSHAGLHPCYQPADGYNAAWALAEETRAYNRLQQNHRRSNAGGSSWLFRCGMDRGGTPGRVGGPLWLGWESFLDAPPLKQIVGHTALPKPASRGQSWNLDTSLHHVGLLQNGTLTVERVR